MSDVKCHMGIWLPAHEQHMSDWISKRMAAVPGEMVNGKGTYQYHKLLASMKWVRNFGTAIDVGAHCGLWSMHLARRFESLYAFEPVGLHRKCFNQNVKAEDAECAVTLYDHALGEETGEVGFHTTHTSSGDSYVDNAAKDDYLVPVKRLDDVLGNPIRADFIKLDCEGYELFALRGGEELLKRSRPVVIVEQKPGRAQKYGLPETGAVAYLESLGAKLRREIGGDYIMSWDEPVPESKEPPEDEQGVDAGGAPPSPMYR